MTIEEINVYAASGGQGCTTLALLLALKTGARFDTYQPEAASCILGSPAHLLESESRGPLRVYDIGTAEHDPPGLNVAILRGPTYPALSALTGHGVRPDKVVLLEHPFMALNHRDVENVLEQPVFIIGFDPDLQRAIDAGLLVSRRPQWVTELVAWLGLEVSA